MTDLTVADAVGVVVPVRDEEAHVATAIAAVAACASTVPIPVALAVVLDGCSDASGQVVERCVSSQLAAGRLAAGKVVELGGDGNVGVARRTGMAAVLDELASVPLQRVWLATTDADSRVPCCWLHHQLERRQAGHDAWAGTVTVRDWSERPSGIVGRFADRYRRTAGLTGHVHGTSLGFAAVAYLAAGGFATVPTGEDRRLWRALGENGARRVHDARCPVVTSARRAGRAPHGFAAYLDRLEDVMAAPIEVGSARAVAQP